MNRKKNVLTRPAADVVEHEAAFPFPDSRLAYQCHYRGLRQSRQKPSGDRTRRRKTGRPVCQPGTPGAAGHPPAPAAPLWRPGCLASRRPRRLRPGAGQADVDGVGDLLVHGELSLPDFKQVRREGLRDRNTGAPGRMPMAVSFCNWFNLGA